MNSSHIRNFSIIAHIDHGKSTLADRMIELTQTIEKRVMKDQVLDSMELERERGITIKMQPVRMNYRHNNEQYVLNLIDTPGHIDFSYEVSRALKAVEGTLLLVDSTQGMQAQTLTVLDMALELGITIIPVVTKTDSPLARITEVKKEISDYLLVEESEILEVSGKTGAGVDALLQTIIEKIPAPVEAVENAPVQGLVFDYSYSGHRGIIIYLRLIAGSIKKGDELTLLGAGVSFIANEVGVFAPQETPVSVLEEGMIGYVVTGFKEAGVASVGDTVTNKQRKGEMLAGYSTPVPMVFASLYPEAQDDFPALTTALKRLSLSDSSFTFEEETSGVLGRGYRCGFLGMLHLEIITERLRREHNLELIITQPSVTYRITTKNDEILTVYSPIQFPDYGNIKQVEEPWVITTLMFPNDYMNNVMKLLHEHEGEITSTETLLDGRVKIIVNMPLRELMRNFFDELKSASSGYASISYKESEYRNADVVRLDILLADEPVVALTKIVARRRLEEDAEKFVEKLEDILPRQQIVVKIQAKAIGRIVASRTLKSFRKDVTGYLYGGDITRKMKLLEKQKKGKKKMQQTGKVNLDHDVFIKIMKS